MKDAPLLTGVQFGSGYEVLEERPLDDFNLLPHTCPAMMDQTATGRKNKKKRWEIMIYWTRI